MFTLLATFVVFSHKTSKLSQYILNSFEIESIILILDIKLLKNTPCAIA